MSLREELERFEVALGRLAPGLPAVLAQPSTDGELDALRESIAPYGLPEDVTTLFQWHGGIKGNAVAGYDLGTAQQLIAAHARFASYDPPVLIPLFGNGFGARLSVEALHQFDRDEAIWFKGKDTGPSREYGSLERLFQVLVAAYENGLVKVVAQHEVPYVDVVDVDRYEELRAEIDPIATPTLRYRRFFADPGWPASWLDSVGIDKAANLPTGHVTSSIRDAALAPVGTTLTVRGMVDKGIGYSGGVIWFGLSDPDGNRLLVSADADVCAYRDFLSPGTDVEVGVTIGDPGLVEESSWKNLSGTPATALAIRPYARAVP